MIKFIKRKKLDVKKYDECIEKSIQSNIFGYSWYLDIVCDNWSVFVLNDYEAVMPIPWRRKFFIKYTYQPLWAIQLGIYTEVIEDENEFLIELFSEFRYVNLRMNFKNSFSMFSPFQIERQIQILNFKLPYEKIIANFRKDRRKDISKAKKNNLIEKWNDVPESLIKLHRDNVGRRAKDFSEKEYEKLLMLIKLSIVKRKGEILAVYDQENRLVASGFFLKDKRKIVKLISSTDFKNRKNGANTFLIEKAIYKYNNQYDAFNFGGSSMGSIAKFNLSFGSETKNYVHLKYNNLPKLLKFFKK